MKSHLSISVVIPTYNRASMIARAVSSALCECEEDDEVIVVDDGSTDDTESVVQRMVDDSKGQLRYIKIENSGAGVARNTGIREAQNDLVAFLDSDDEWMPGKLRFQRMVMQARPEVIYCFSNFGVRLADGIELHNQMSTWYDDDRPWTEILGPAIPSSEFNLSSDSETEFNVYIGDLYRDLAENLYIFTGTMIVRREEAGEALAFAHDMATYEDWVCYAKVAGKGKGAFLDRETAWQYGHDQARLTDANPLKTASARIYVLENVWGKDKPFMSKDSAYIHRLLEQQYIKLGTELMLSGQAQSARDYYVKCSSTPRVHMLMSYIPATILRSLLSLKKVLANLV